MTSRDDVHARKTDAAQSATSNHQTGVDGDDPSDADQPDSRTPTDPVTRTAANQTGDEQANENSEHESPA